MDPRLAQGLPEALSQAGNAQLRRVEEDATAEAQRRKDEEKSREAPAPSEEPGYGHGV